MSDFDGRIVDLYRGELDYLRQSGRVFSEKYPKIAARLELSDQESPDPQVERLLESFAYLTARIQARIDDQNALVPSAILGQLHPYLIEPTPPMSTAYFKTTLEQQVAPSGKLLPRGTPLYIQTGQGDFCRFVTRYDVDLRPLEIVGASIEPVSYHKQFDTSKVASVLKIEISGQGLPVSEVSISNLRIHLAGDLKDAMDLHELLCSNVVATALVGDEENQLTYINHSIVSEVGFKDSEAVLEDKDDSLSAYRLLSEYFVWPSKFLYLDFNELDKRPPGKKLTILLGLDQPASRNLTVKPRNFLLGCTPVVNLFKKTLEPIRLDYTREQYFLEPEAGGLINYEIHSINRVSISSPAVKQMRTLEPYFSFKHKIGSDIPKEFWFATRSGAGAGLQGSQMHISFVDTDFTPQRPGGETATIQALCTNRNLVEQLPIGAVFQGDEDLGALATIISKPSPTVYAPLDGATLWRLVSQLNLNHFSFSRDEASIDALREILRLYCPDYRPSAFQEVMGLRQLEVEQVVRRVGAQTWRGFCRGNKVKLRIDERNFVGGNPFLLGSILSRFFSLYASVNSFSELEIETLQREGVWKTWHPVIGEQASI